MAIPGNAETLERLLIEIVGDDSNLKTVLDEAVKAAQKAAAEMRDSLNLDWSKVTQGAQQAATAFDQVAPAVKDVNATFDQFVTGSQRAFDDVRQAGSKTSEQFEEYRRTMLETIESQRPLAQSLGYTSSAMDDLAKHVREATYEQSQAARETERTKQEQEELAAVMKRLSNEVRSSRNDWAGMRTDTDQFQEDTRKSKEELEQLITTVERGSDAYRKISQDIAYAQRGLDSANKVASRGGLAWTTQIALANQFGQSLRGFGPAGSAAAAGLGFMEGRLNKLIPKVKEGDSVLRMLGLTSLRFAAVWLPVATALAPLIGAGLLAKLSADAAKAARELENATYRTGLTVEGLQELQHAARQTGVPLDLLNTTMQRLQRRAADANAGNKGLQQSFRALGVTLTDEHGKMRTTEDLLGQVADGLNRVESDADRLALAFKVFDTEGGRLLPLLNEGAEGIRRLREEARELGLVVSGDTVMSLSQLDAEIQTVMQQFSVLRMEVAGSFLPVMQGALLPLVEQRLIPALQNVADDISDFADRFFDATEAGAAFRADTVKNLQAVVVLGKGVVAAAQAVWGAINTIVGVGASAYGAGQGLADWQANHERILERRRDLLEQIAYMESQLQEDWAAPGTQASLTISQNLQAAREELASLPASWREAMEEGARLAGGAMAQNAVDGFTGMLNTLQADVAAEIEALLEGTDFTRPARRAGRNAGDEFGNSFGDGTREALEGSLKYAQEQLQKAQEELGHAVGAEARAEQLAVVKLWEEAVALIGQELADFDPAKHAKIWTARLAAELRFGIKDAAEVFNILNPHLEELREEAGQALAEFGIDSTQYQDALAKLEVVEALVTSIKDEANAIDLSGLLRSVGGGFALPETGADPTAGLLAGLQLIMRIEQAEADLEGRALKVGDAFAWMLPILEDQLKLVERGSDEWFTIAALVKQIRGDVEAVDASELLRSIGGGFSLPETGVSPISGLVQGLQLIMRIEEAEARLEGRTISVSEQFEWMLPILEDQLALVERGSDEWLTIADLITRIRGDLAALDVSGLLQSVGGGFAMPQADKSVGQALVEGFRLITRTEEALAGMRGEVADLTGDYEWMVELLDEHAATLEQGSAEWLLVVEQANEYRKLLEAMPEFNFWGVGGFALPEQFKTATDGLIEGHALILRMAAAEDVLAGSNRDLASTYEGMIEEMLLHINTLEHGSDAWLQAVEAVAAYVKALDDLADNTAAEKAAEGWRTASDNINAFLTVNQSNLNNLRKAAVEAFEAGVIGADELGEALRRIDVMEVVENLRQLGAELGGAGGIIPNLMAGMGQAWEQLTAGNTTDAVATAFNAATSAVQSLGAAFEDTARQGEAMLDLVIGAAAGIATAIGGPAMGQAVGAVGNFIKSILGDLSNGLAEIQKQIDQTASRSTYLGEELITGIAEGATQQVSRGGILGWLGFTKAALDEDAYRAGITLAEGIASGLVGTLRSGDFEQAWDSMIQDIMIDGVIKAFLASQVVQDAILEAYEALRQGDTTGAADALNQVKEDFRFIYEQIEEITGATGDLAVNVSGALTSGFQNALNSSTWDEAWGKATQSMKQTLRDSIVAAFMESAAMKKIFEAFNAALGDALEDGVISDAEMRRLERLYGQTEGPMRELWDALERLGLGFDDLNDTVKSVTGNLSNLPSVFLDTQAMFDSITRSGAGVVTQPGFASPGRGDWWDRDAFGGPVDPNGRWTITINGDVYGYDDFEARVNDAVSRGQWRSGIATHGVSR